MIIYMQNNIINTKNIAILKREKNINTNSYITKYEHYISINGVKIQFSTEQERDKWFNTIERAMASE